LLFYSNLFAEVNDKLQQKLSYNNHFLDINYNKRILAFIMIYFHQLKNNKDSSLIDSLSHLLSSSTNTQFKEVKKYIKTTLASSKNPIQFYKKLKQISR